MRQTEPQTESQDSTDFKPEKLIIGAERISEEFFGGELSPDQVYRLPKDGWPIFKVRGKLATRPASMRAEMSRREAEVVKRGRAT
jgi:hypothetical protein